MATLKHIASKNADYGAAERYLTFEHDEFTGKEVRDADGHLIPRAEYRMDTVLCGEEDFAIACMKANLRFRKNDHKGDVKSHHYILSFDPRDATDNGLTVDRAQALGLEFCKKNFPGHQAIVVTHPDGHNHSGNIHTHIVINSLRIEDVPQMPYMDRTCDTKAGMKHRVTAPFFRYLRSEVMELCQREGLYQIDLLSGSKNRITEKEHWVQRRAEQKPESTDAASSQPQTKFETDKEKLRNTIRAILADAQSMDDFIQRLLQMGVTVKESRGRFSYLMADRTKPITSRKLGDDFSKEAVIARIKVNVERKRESPILQSPIKEQPSISPFTHQSKTTSPKPRKPQKIQQRIAADQKISRMIDLEKKREEGKGEGYINWGKSFNLKQQAKTWSYFNKHGFSSPDEMEAAYQAAAGLRLDLSHRLNALDQQIRGKKDLQNHLQSYRKGKEIYTEYQSIRNEKKRNAYYEQHRTGIVLTEAAIAFFKKQNMTKLPSDKKVQDEIEALIQEKNALYQEYRAAKEKEQELRTVTLNMQQMLGHSQAHPARKQPAKNNPTYQ